MFAIPIYGKELNADPHSTDKWGGKLLLINDETISWLHTNYNQSASYVILFGTPYAIKENISDIGETPVKGKSWHVIHQQQSIFYPIILMIPSNITSDDYTFARTVIQYEYVLLSIQDSAFTPLNIDRSGAPIIEEGLIFRDHQRRVVSTQNPVLVGDNSMAELKKGIFIIDKQKRIYPI